MSTPAPKPPFPAGIFVAGTLWLGMGVLVASSTFAWFVAKPAYAQIRSGVPSSPYYYTNYAAPGDQCALWVGTMLGAIFVPLGFRAVTGAGRGTAAAGLFSVAVGIAFLVPGVAAAFLARSPQPLLVASGTVCLALAIICLGAGLLALVGHTRYRTWYRARQLRGLASDPAA